jgi:hypothetical protein
VKSGLRRGPEHLDTIPFEPVKDGGPRWKPALEALSGQVTGGTLAGADVTLVLSSVFVRYALVPRNDALNSETEQLAYAHHRFASIYGKDSDEWMIRLAPAKAGQARLACAIEQGLVEALDEIMAPLGARYHSLQPHLATSFNFWRREIGKRSVWFVVVESGVMSVVRLQDGQWASLRTMRVSSRWATELPSVLAREEFLSDSPVTSNEVLVYGPLDHQLPEAGKGKWRFRSLTPTAVSDVTSGDNENFEFKEGARA